MVEDEVYVMLMMMRADDSYSPDSTEGCTAEELLACITADDYDACIAACADEPEEPGEDEVVKNGTLTVSVTDYSSEVVSAPVNGTVVFNKIKLSASEEITVDTLTLKKTGLFNNSAVYKVWFEKDGVRVSSKASLTSDGTATVNFTKGLTVKSNETVDLIVSLNGTDLGAEVAFTVDSVDSTAEKVNLKNATTTTYRTANYNILQFVFSAVPNTPSATAITYKLGDQDEYEFGRFKVTNNLTTSVERDGVIKSITLTTDNSDVEALLTNIRLVRDGEDVAKNVDFDGKKLTITLDDTIAAGKVATYILYAGIDSLTDDNETVQFYLKDIEDIVGQESDTAFRTWNLMANNGGTPAVEYSILNKYQVNGGNIVLKGDSTFAKTVEAGAGSSDVQIANGTLTVVDPVTFDSLVLTETTGTPVDGVQSMRLEIGGRSYSASIDATAHTYTFEDIYVNKTSSVKLFVTLKSTITGSPKITFNNIMGGAAGTLSAGDYSNGTRFASTDIAGVINVSDISVKTPTFTLKNNLSTTVRLVKGNSDTVTLFDGTVVSTKNDVTLTEVIVTPATALTAGDSINFTLTVDGKSTSKTLDSTTATLTFPISSVTVNSTAKEIKLEATPIINNLATLPTDYVFAVSANGTSNNNPATATAVNSATLQIVGNSELVVSSINKPNQVKLEGNDAEILRFDATAQYGTVELTEFAVRSTSFAATTNAYLYVVDANGNDEITPVKLTCDTAGCTDNAMNETLSAGKHTFIVKADVKDKTTAVTTTAININDIATAASDKAMATKTLFVKALPEMTGSKNGNILTLEVSNNTNTPVVLTTIGGTKTTNSTVIVNGQTVTLGTAFPDITLVKDGDPAIVEFTAAEAGTNKITSITYYVMDGATKYTYTIDDTYQTFPWGTYQITYSN